MLNESGPTEQDMLVSVIIPVFNREDTIVAAMQSVLDQDYKNIELIVVDDCSTDNSCKRIDGLNDPRIRLIRRKQNGGAAASRNTGIEHARGQLIAFQDSDDLWLPGKLRRQVTFLSQQPANIGVVYGGKIVYGKEAMIKGQRSKVSYSPPLKNSDLPFSPVFEELLTMNRLTIQTALFRMSSLPNGLVFDESLGFDEDWEFAVRLSLDTILMELAEPLVLAFISDNSISQPSEARFSRALLQIQRKHRQKLRDLPAQSAELRYRLGKSLQENGRAAIGTKFILQACMMRPWMVKWWVKYLVVRVAA